MSIRSLQRLLLLPFWVMGMSLLILSPRLGLAQIIHDGSFEGYTGQQIPLEGHWATCQGAPDLQILDGFGNGIYAIHTPAAQGQRYLGMLDTDYELHESVGQAMRIEAGMHYFGSVALFKSLAHQSWDGTGQLQIWGSQSCSQHDELLWASGTVDNVDVWQYYNIEFSAALNHDWITLEVAMDQGSGRMSYLCIDDLFLSNEFLAVDFLNFDALPTADAIQLTWETAALPDDANFGVEWSADGQHFATIGNVAALGGETQFTYTHQPSTPGQQYYRLRTVDLGGHESLSEVRQTLWNTDGGLRVYPNPAQNQVSINQGSPISQVQLYDMGGRLVYSLSVDECTQTTLTIPQQLSNGCYQLQTVSKAQVQHLRVMVQR